MMSLLAILSAKEQIIFDNPPDFSAETRAKAFKLTSYELELVRNIYKHNNKMVF